MRRRPMMEYGSIPGVGKPVSRLVLGTMIISHKDPSPPGEEYPYLGLKGSFDLLDAVFENGGNAFDTAHGYGMGASELGLGLWMKERGNRDRVVIITKGGVRRAKPRITPGFLDADLYDSLRRLQTDYIDVYLFHHDDPSAPVGPLVEALNEHLRAGRIHAFGGSNFTHQRIAEANEYAERRGLTPFVASEPNYGLAEQVKDPWGPGCVTLSGPANRRARAWYEANQMAVVPYSSLGRGFFSGRLTRDNFEEMKSTLGRACVTAYCHEVNFTRLDRAMLLAKEKGATVPQIAIAFMLGSRLSVFPLIGAASREEFEENVRALDISLTEKERAWLDLEIDDR